MDPINKPELKYIEHTSKNPVQQRYLKDWSGVIDYADDADIANIVAAAKKFAIFLENAYIPQNSYEAKMLQDAMNDWETPEEKEIREEEEMDDWDKFTEMGEELEDDGDEEDEDDDWDLNKIRGISDEDDPFGEF